MGGLHAPQLSRPSQPEHRPQVGGRAGVCRPACLSSKREKVEFRGFRVAKEWLRDLLAVCEIVKKQARYRWSVGELNKASAGCRRQRKATARARAARPRSGPPAPASVRLSFPAVPRRAALVVVPRGFSELPAERPGGRVGAFVAVGLFRGCWLIVGSLARAPRLAIRVLCVGIFFPLQRRWPGVVAADHSIGAGPPISMYCRQAARRRRRRMC